MLLGGFAASGPGALVKINDIMNSTKYQNILAKNLVASARKLRLGRRWTFQQLLSKNYPKHTVVAKIIRTPDRSENMYLFCLQNMISYEICRWLF